MRQNSDTQVLLCSVAGETFVCAYADSAVGAHVCYLVLSFTCVRADLALARVSRYSTAHSPVARPWGRRNGHTYIGTLHTCCTSRTPPHTRTHTHTRARARTYEQHGHLTISLPTFGRKTDVQSTWPRRDALARRQRVRAARRRARTSACTE